jgi:Zn-dependent M28 family amino/carboxypeptidase
VFLGVIASTLLAAYWITTQPLVTPRRSTPPTVEPARLAAHVRQLSESLYPRSFDHPEKLNAAASYIAEEFRKTGARVEEQYFTAQSKYRNIIARFGPDTGPLIIVGAHYDSYGDASRGAKFPSGFDRETHTPGADDNASGVAGLIELAHLLNRTAPRASVELVAFSLEEQPNFSSESIGSVWHAKSLRASGRVVLLMISLEMIGYFSDLPGSQGYPFAAFELIYPTRGNFIGIVGRFQDWSATRKVKAAMSGATDLPVYSMNGLRAIPGVNRSDHASYWNEGFPALMITDTAFYRNPHYHRSGDTTNTLDFSRMAKVVQGVFETVRNYGDE